MKYILCALILALPLSMAHGDLWKNSNRISFSDLNVSDEDLTCLANAIFFEARNQKTDDAKLAVAFVVLNRVESKRYPDSICKVTRQKKHPKYHQFSYHNSPRLSWIARQGLAYKIDQKAYSEAKKLAKTALLVKEYAPELDVTKGAMYYFNPKIVKKPSWAKSPKLQKVGSFGDHEFYKRVKN